MMGVTVTGYVKEVAPFMAGAKVFVLPFRVGSGTRLKMIEAMAAGKSIVSTNVGAEGYEFQDNEELIIADDPQQFANAVLNLLSRPQERVRLGQAATVAARQYDWRVVIPKFDDVYEGLLAN
jgi:glycosyltransferase involved in cell wall biosynthesis